MSALPATTGSRENPSAVGEIIDVVNTKKAETDVFARIVGIPVFLSAGARKGEELGIDTGILGEHNVAAELEDPRRSPAQSLLVKEGVPYAGGTILGITEAGRVNEALLAGRVGANQGGETVGLDGLGAEELNQRVRVGVDIGEETVGAGGVAVTAANERTNTGTTYTVLAEGGNKRGGREETLTEGTRRWPRYPPSG